MKYIINDYYKVEVAFYFSGRKNETEILKLVKETKGEMLFFKRGKANNMTLPAVKNEVQEHYPEETHPELYL